MFLLFNLDLKFSFSKGHFDILAYAHLFDVSNYCAVTFSSHGVSSIQHRHGVECRELCGAGLQRGICGVDSYLNGGMQPPEQVRNNGVPSLDPFVKGRAFKPYPKSR